MGFDSADEHECTMRRSDSDEEERQVRAFAGRRRQLLAVAVPPPALEGRFLCNAVACCFPFSDHLPHPYYSHLIRARSGPWHPLAGSGGSRQPQQRGAASTNARRLLVCH